MSPSGAERSLAERYQVSQMPVREAIQRLQGEGLVTLTPNYGARMRSFDSTFIAELYELRAELHAFSHRTTFADWDPALPDKLTAIQSTYEEALERDDIAACQVANINFHELVNKRCSNSEVMRILQSQERLVRTMRSALGYSQTPARAGLGALASDPRDQASRHGRRHGNSARTRDQCRRQCHRTVRGSADVADPWTLDRPERWRAIPIQL
jgi:DNA-binding GntR family transcriptional regulator